MTLYIQPDRSQWWSVDTVTMTLTVRELLVDGYYQGKYISFSPGREL
jgi:hypothetical protein